MSHRQTLHPHQDGPKFMLGAVSFFVIGRQAKEVKPILKNRTSRFANIREMAIIQRVQRG